MVELGANARRLTPVTGSVMTHTDALSLGVRRVRDQIARVKVSLAAVAAEYGVLYDRVEDRLAELLVESEDKLAAAENELAAAGVDGSASLKLREAREAARLLFRESFAFVEGALSRRAGLDDGFCELADKLLDSLSSNARELNWRGLTILAETSFYGEAADHPAQVPGGQHLASAHRRA